MRKTGILHKKASFPSVAVILTAPLQGKTKIFVSDHLNHSLMMNFSTKQK